MKKYIVEVTKSYTPIIVFRDAFTGEVNHTTKMRARKKGTQLVVNTIKQAKATIAAMEEDGGEGVLVRL